MHSTGIEISQLCATCPQHTALFWRGAVQVLEASSFSSVFHFLFLDSYMPLTACSSHGWQGSKHDHRTILSIGTHLIGPVTHTHWLIHIGNHKNDTAASEALWTCSRIKSWNRFDFNHGSVISKILAAATLDDINIITLYNTKKSSTMLSSIVIFCVIMMATVSAFHAPGKHQRDSPWLHHENDQFAYRKYFGRYQNLSNATTCQLPQSLCPQDQPAWPCSLTSSRRRRLLRPRRQPWRVSLPPPRSSSPRRPSLPPHSRPDQEQP